MPQVANENTGCGAAPSVTDSVFQDKSNLWALALGSVGVVYGDIGTSPLYAFRVAVVAAVESGPVTRDIVLGVLSLILWALIVVVAIKYVLLLLRADKQRGGRHPVLYRAGNARVRAAGPAGVPARGRRSLHVPGRRGDHAGDFGVVGGRVLNARHARIRALRRAAHHRHPARLVCGAEPRNRPGGELLRAGHGDLVRRHCGSRTSAYSR